MRHSLKLLRFYWFCISHVLFWGVNRPARCLMTDCFYWSLCSDENVTTYIYKIYRGLWSIIYIYMFTYRHWTTFRNYKIEKTRMIKCVILSYCIHVLRYSHFRCSKKGQKCFWWKTGCDVGITCYVYTYIIKNIKYNLCGSIHIRYTYCCLPLQISLR